MLTQAEQDLMKPDIRLLGAISPINPFMLNNSSSRLSMDQQHVAQAVAMVNPDIQSINSGMSYEYADYTYAVTIKGEPDQEVRIIDVVKKYSRTGTGSVEQNPTYYVIYENLDTGVFDVSIVPHFYFNHMYFGFRYIKTDVFKDLRKGDILSCGTKLAIPASIDNDDGIYSMGLNVNTVMGSFPEVIEDGIAISESLSERMSTYQYQTMSINYGSENYLLNLYGDDNNYKPFPDIGEYVRDDGLLFATRPLDPMLAAVQMTPKALQTVDYTFDRLMYSIPGAKVVDITVHHTHNPSLDNLPSDMSKQPMKYFLSKVNTDNTFKNIYEKLKSTSSNGRIELSPELHHLITWGMELDHNNLSRQNKVTYRREELEAFRVTITVERVLPMCMAHKTASMDGGKGVITKIIPDHLMPIDDNGVRADMLIDDNSVIHRMNTSKLWEHEMNAILDNMRISIKNDHDNGISLDTIWSKLLEFYQNVSPVYYDLVKDGISNRDSISTHIDDFITGNASIYLPIGSVHTGLEHSVLMDSKYPLKYGPITIFDPNGNPVRTKRDFLIAKLYFIRLEKIGNNWASTSVPKRQHHGVISKLSDYDKNSLPYRSQSIRVGGETEVRLIMAASTPAFVTSLMSLANNADMTNDAVQTILEADSPVVVKEMVDYSKLDEYESRALEMTKHMMFCSGLEFYYEDERDHTYEEYPELAVEAEDALDFKEED